MEPVEENDGKNWRKYREHVWKDRETSWKVLENDNGFWTMMD